MSMNQVIQRRRRELGMTQEQVAQALNVTAPAVNKWEKGATCPDVSLLAPLARLLKIDLNELLCFREELTAEKARQLILKTDKRRASYYEYYSSQKWGAVESYDFCLDSSVFGIDGTVALIQKLVEMKEAQAK